MIKARACLSMLVAMLLSAIAAPAFAEDGYELWLRYHPLPAAHAATLAARATGIVAPGDSPTVRAAVAELRRGFAGMTGHEPAMAGAVQAGTLLLARPDQAAALGLARPSLADLGRDGFWLHSATVRGRRVTAILANSDTGLLYGAFRLLELAEQGARLDALDLRSAPKLQLRVLDHWDNLDRHGRARLCRPVDLGLVDAARL